MKNLLKETIEVLAENGKTPQDVVWVGSKRFDYYSTWSSFEEVANFEYHEGYGSNEIADDLLIVGKDFWLERGEYDGSEWWNFKSFPEQPKNLRNVPIVDQEDVNHIDDKEEMERIERIIKGE